MKEYKYHQWNTPDCERHFGVKTEKGLSNREADLRLKKHGANSLLGNREVTPFTVFLRQFKNIFVVLLVLATVISYFVDGVFEAIILVIIILVNVAVGFYQEYKAEKTLFLLKNTLSYKSRVLREGEIIEIDSSMLVPGDIIILREGDKISADTRLIFEQGVRVDESTLTGESAPVSKHTKVLPLETPLAERENMAFSGTVVYAGVARGIVVETGRNSEFGKIAEMVSGEEESTPLKIRIAYISKILFIISSILVLIIFALGLWRGYDILKLLTFSIALFVAAVPESLPTIITLALAIGVSNMVKKNAIVRRLSVIEALGSVNIIATDKTGTLTKNELSVANCAYYKKDDLININQYKSHQAQELLFYGALASSATGEKQGKFVGDPLETAIFECLKEVNLGRRHRFKVEEEIPFDSDKKYMIVRGKLDWDNIVVVKGAVERVLPFCRLKKVEIIEIESAHHRFAESGLKTIAVCKKVVSAHKIGDLKRMEFLGLLAFSDQPIENIEQAMEDTRNAGIRSIIITGDNPKTAKYVANNIGLCVTDEEIVSGVDIANLTDRGLREKLKTVKIFARTTPADKIRIVQSLENMGFVVAVTGDGVNDAPALKAATVGIAMGKRGSDVAREASDIILADDNYATIISAIAYGRAIYDNIKNALIFLLASSFNEVFIIGIAFLANLPTPLTVTQILWINLVTDSFPAISLAFESPHRGALKQKPRSSKVADIKPSVFYSVYLSVVLLVIGFIFYLWGLHTSVDKARTLVFFVSIISVLLFSLSIRSRYRIWQNFGEVFSNNFLNISVFISFMLAVITIFPPMQPFFGTTNLNSVEVVALVVAGATSFLIAEIIRAIIDRRKRFYSP